MKTLLPTDFKKNRQWHVMDADGQVLGRLATRVATLLRGKHKPTFSTFLDVGDGVIVINAEKIRVTGRKAQLEKVYRHSGYPGGLRTDSLGTLLKEKPERVINDAVRGMLPQTRLGERMIRRLRVYKGAEHTHAAQKPTKAEVTR
jgi:large subunit ribosomal protein L13